jgi:hypothetical protein
MDLGIERLSRETYASSLEMAAGVLEALGFSEAHAHAVVAKFRAYDEALISRTHAIHKDESQLIQAAQRVPEELRALFEEDAAVRAGAAAEPARDPQTGSTMTTTVDP